MSALYVDISVRAADALLAPQGHCFSHAEACRLVVRALRAQAQRIVIDLARIDDATTSAFAQLVLLRRILRKTGRDLAKIATTSFGAANLEKFTVWTDEMKA